MSETVEIINGREIRRLHMSWGVDYCVCYLGADHQWYPFDRQPDHTLQGARDYAHTLPPVNYEARTV